MESACTEPQSGRSARTERNARGVEKSHSLMIPAEIIENKIYFIRGKKVMLDIDLANLYSVETKQLIRQVKRNIDRFPADFMFQLTKEESENLRCQIGTSKWACANLYGWYNYGALRKMSAGEYK